MNLELLVVHRLLIDKLLGELLAALFRVGLLAGHRLLGFDGGRADDLTGNSVRHLVSALAFAGLPSCSNGFLRSNVCLDVPSRFDEQTCGLLGSHSNRILDSFRRRVRCVDTGRKLGCYF